MVAPSRAIVLTAALVALVVLACGAAAGPGKVGSKKHNGVEGALRKRAEHAMLTARKAIVRPVHAVAAAAAAPMRTHRRRFAAQDDHDASLIDGLNITCAASGFTDLVAQMEAKCDDSAFAMLIGMGGGMGSDNLAGLEAFCAIDACGGLIAQFAATDAYMQCLRAAGGESAELAFVLPMFGATCVRVDGQLCITSLSMLGGHDSCDMAWNETQCLASGEHCRWRHGAWCETDMSVAVTSMCSDTTRRCITAMSGGAGGRFGGEQEDGFGDLDSVLDLVCTEHNGELCLPQVGMIFDMGGGSDDHYGSEEDYIAYACNDRNLFGCMQALLPKISAQQRNEAEQDYIDCMHFHEFVDPSGADNFCRDQYKFVYQEAAMMERLLTGTCARNERGEWCWGLLNKYELLEEECLVPISEQNATCSARCDTALSAMFSDLGCCIGSLVWMTQPVSFDDSSLPSVPPAPTGWGSFDFAGGRSVTSRRATVSSMHDHDHDHGSGSGHWGDHWDGDEYFEPFDIEAAFRSLAACPSIAPGIDAAISNRCEATTELRTVDPCFAREFRGLAQQLRAQCENSSDVLGLQFSSFEEANASLASFCASSCASTARSLHARFQRCMDPNTLMAVRGGIAYCEQAPNKDFCGAQLLRFSELECDSKNEASCAAAPQCRWAGDECDAHPTAAFLEGVCTPCLGTIMNAVGSTAASEVAVAQQLLCGKIDNQFCLPLVAELGHDVDSGEGLNNTQLESVCESSVTRRCLTLTVSGASAIAQRHAEEEYRNCAIGASSVNSANTCAESYERSIHGIRSTSAEVNALCSRNENNEFCMVKLHETMAHRCMSHLEENACPGTCDSEIAALVNDLGCCLGIIHQVKRPRRLYVDDLPGVRAAVFRPSSLPNRTAEAEAADALGNTTDRGNGVFRVLACPSAAADLVDRVRQQCGALRASQPVTRRQPLPVSFERVRSDPALERRLVASLRTDTATALGVPPDDIENARLERDENTRIRPRSSARRMRTLSDDSGTVFVFDLQASTDEEAAAIAAEYDTLVATNRLALPTATAVTEDCRCVDSTAASLASTAAPLVAPEPAEGPAGDGAARGAAAVWATALLLLIALASLCGLA